MVRRRTGVIFASRRSLACANNGHLRLCYSSSSSAATENVLFDEGAAQDGYRTLYELQKRSVELFKEKPYIGERNADGTFSYITYGEFDERVRQFRFALHTELGVRKNDAVMAISNNRLEWAIGMHACLGLGAVWTPCYEQQHMNDWVHICSDSKAKVLCVANDAIFERANALRSKVDTLKHIVCFEHAKEMGSTSFEKLLSLGEGMDSPESPPAENDMAALIYTSGTTGKPKGVMLTHDNLCSNVAAVKSILPKIESSDRSLSILPWAHSFGQTCELHSSMVHGMSFAVCKDPKTDLLDDIKHVKPSILIAVPQVYSRIYDGVFNKMAQQNVVVRTLFEWCLDAAKRRRLAFDTGRAGKSPITKIRWEISKRLMLNKIKELFGGNLRVAITGGSALAHEVQEFFDDIGVPCVEGYGLTETSPMALAERYAPTELLQGGLQPIPRVNALIMAPGSEQVLEDGIEGELVISGPNVMKGYWQNPDETEKVVFDFDGKRCFRTGDLAKKMPSTAPRPGGQNCIKITGRVKELYKLSNGKYVAPAPIEDCLKLSRFVDQVMLYGADKPFNVAFVVPNFDAVAAHLQLDASGDKEVLFETNQKAIQTLIESEVAACCDNHNVKAYEVPKKIRIWAKELTVEDGFLTPKQSLKRNVVIKAFENDINDIYSGVQ